MAILDSQIIEVQNLTGHIVAYKIEEDNVRRVFDAYESKKVSAGELRKLNYKYGGHVLLTNNLRVNNKELAKEIGVPEDCIEYWWTNEDVDDLLMNGLLDSLLDALDFGPDGIVAMIKDRAIELKLNDMNKRQAIFNKTGFDINKMIEIAEAGSTNDEVISERRERRVKNNSTTESTGRRVS